MLKLRAGACSQQGGRASQQDRLFIGDKVCVVADGMGGLDHGDIAAEIAVEFCKMIQCIGDMNLAYELANDRILHEAKQRGVRCMGTTCTTLLFDLQAAAIDIGHVGDSRLYRLRMGILEQITQDHVLYDDLLRRGNTPRQALAWCKKKGRNPQGLYQSLGLRSSVSPDFSSESLLPGDRFLLCTDGVSGPLNSTDISPILGGFSDPQQTAETLVDLAIHCGGIRPDNATAIVVHVEK